jgi:hypothetical protein
MRTQAYLAAIAHTDKPHRRPRHRLADCRRIRGVVLLPANIGLYISRRHHARIMAKLDQFARPMMRRPAGLKPHQATSLLQMLFQRQPSWHGSSLSQMPRGRRPHHQSKFYTACSRTMAGWSPTVFARELPPRSAGFNAENRLYSFALTMPLWPVCRLCHARVLCAGGSQSLVRSCLRRILCARLDLRILQGVVGQFEICDGVYVSDGRSGPN